MADKKISLWERMFSKRKNNKVIFTNKKLFKESENCINNINKETQKSIQKLLKRHLSKESKKEREICWRNLHNYKGSDRYDLTKQFHTLHLFVQGVIPGYKKITIIDYKDILDNLKTLTKHRRKIEERLKERKKLRSKIKDVDLKKSKWNLLIKDIEINEETISYAFPCLFIEYATILKLRAGLELKNHTLSKNLTSEYEKFVETIDKLITSNKLEIITGSNKPL